MLISTIRFRAIRSSENRRNYHARRQAVDDRKALNIPQRALNIALLPLPTSGTFVSISRSPAVTDSELHDDNLRKIFQHLLDLTPTTPTTHPNDFPTAQHYCDAFHGWQFRLQREYEDSRMQRMCHGPELGQGCPERLDVLRLLKEFRNQWVELKDLLQKPARIHHAYIMFGSIVWLWKARRWRDLREDYHAMEVGMDQFRRVYLARWEGYARFGRLGH